MIVAHPESHAPQGAPATKPVLFSPPSIGDEEVRRVVAALGSGWLTTGPLVAEFEQKMAELLRAPATLAVNSCTAALGLALRVLGVGPGDEVITSVNTFVSTVNVIEHAGARPVLVDVEPDTLNLSAETVAPALSPRTKAVIAVHFAGHPVDLTPLERLCRSRGVAVVEDAAHALPAAVEGRTIGGTGNLTALSFYATKNLTTGEGGMLAGPPELVERARTLSLHGMSRDAWNRYGAAGSWRYDVVDAGFKCNMTDLAAAVGLGQLERLGAMQARRGEVFRRYSEAFATAPELQRPTVRPGVSHAWHLYVLRLRGALALSRDALFGHLAARGVRASVHFIPVASHSYYREKYALPPSAFPVAYDAFGRMLSLPLSPALSDPDVERVVEGVMSFVEAAGEAPLRSAA